MEHEELYRLLQKIVDGTLYNNIIEAAQLATSLKDHLESEDIQVVLDSNSVGSGVCPNYWPMGRDSVVMATVPVGDAVYIRMNAIPDGVDPDEAVKDFEALNGPSVTFGWPDREKFSEFVEYLIDINSNLIDIFSERYHERNPSTR